MNELCEYQNAWCKDKKIKTNVSGDSSVHPATHMSVLTLLMFCGVTRENTVLLKHLIYLKYTTALCPGYIKT